MLCENHRATCFVNDIVSCINCVRFQQYAAVIQLRLFAQVGDRAFVDEVVLRVEECASYDVDG